MQAAIPTQKNSELFENQRAHLVIYEIDPIPEPTRLVAIDNQFGSQSLIVRGATHFMVPALKNGTPGDLLPVDINHFKCYEAQGMDIGADITVTNQFGTGVLRLTDPVLLCNPAEKETEQGIFPIVNPDDHLVCYEVEIPRAAGPPRYPVLQIGVTLRDQFLVHQANLARGPWFCVPSLKQQVVPSEASTWGRIKTIYR